MFNGDNDGSTRMLSCVYVFYGLQRKIESVMMKEKKMKIKVWDKGKSIDEERVQVNYFSTVMDVIRDEGDEEIHCKLINFLVGCLILYCVYVYERERVQV